MTAMTEKREMAEAQWLHYFNCTLYQQGVIDQRQYHQMAQKIRTRRSASR